MNTLSLDNTHIDSDSLRHLANVPRLQELYLNNTQVDGTSLHHLAGLTRLQWLYLDNTQIDGDSLLHLAGLTGLQSLSLDNTQIDTKSLRALLPLRNLIPEQGHVGGVFMRSTPAMGNDARLRELNQIMDDHDRMVALFAYLEGLEPGEDEGGDPEQLPSLEVRIDTDGRLEIPLNTPDADDAKDRSQTEAHNRLKDAAAGLAKAAGNEYSVLANTARNLLERVNEPFEELDLYNIHIDLHALNGSYDRREEGLVDERLNKNVVDALSQVIEVGPALTHANADVVAFDRRRASFHAPADDVQQAHDDLSGALAHDGGLAGPVLSNLESRMVEMTDAVHSLKGQMQKDLHRNILIATGLAVGAGVAGGFLGEVGVALFGFVEKYMVQMTAIAKTEGSLFANWFARKMQLLPDAIRAVEAVATVEKGPVRVDRRDRDRR